MSPTMNYFSSTLSMIATVFYVIGAIGYSDDNDVIKNVAWITQEQGGVDGYYALRQAYITGSGADLTIKFKDCSGASDTCETCEDNGKGAFALCIIGAVVALLTMFTCGTLSRQVSFPLQLTSILLAAGACIAGLIAISLFMGDCYDKIDDATPDDIEWGPGAVLTIIAMFMMAGVGIVQILSTFICKST